MTASETEEDARHSWVWSAIGKSLRIVWTAVRLPTLAILLLLEPIVCAVLSAVAALGILCALFFEFVARSPHYPFWLMIGISAGLALLMIPYYLLVRLLSGSSK